MLQGTLSIAEMQTQAKNTKTMNFLKEIFLRYVSLMAKTINDLLLSNYHCLYFNHRCVNKDSWEKAEKEYPNFAKEEERLQQFLPLKIKSRGEIPKPFSEYCQVAVNSTNRDSTNVLTHTLTRNGHRCDFIQASYQSISKCMVKQKVDDFQGASLIIAECTSDVSYSI